MKNKVEEFKDKAGDHRLRVTAQNGRILYSSTEGYKNKTEMIKSALRSSHAIIEHYEDQGPTQSPGLEMVIKERNKQLSLGRDAKYDLDNNKGNELVYAARILAREYKHVDYNIPPYSWSKERWAELVGKDNVNRLVTAAALLVAEVDRLLLQSENHG